MAKVIIVCCDWSRHRSINAIFSVIGYFPTHTITVTSKDPPYITPEIKFLLQKKNRLMRGGLLEEASALAKRIASAISRQNRRELHKLDAAAGTKNLWRSVNSIIGSKTCEAQRTNITADELNANYAA